MLRKAALFFVVIGLFFYFVCSLASETSTSSLHSTTYEHSKSSNSDCITPDSVLLAFNQSQPLQSTMHKRGCCSHHRRVSAVVLIMVDKYVVTALYPQLVLADCQ